MSDDDAVTRHLHDLRDLLRRETRKREHRVGRLPRPDTEIGIHLPFQRAQRGLPLEPDRIDGMARIIPNLAPSRRLACVKEVTASPSQDESHGTGLIRARRSRTISHASAIRCAMAAFVKAWSRSTECRAAAW